MRSNLIIRNLVLLPLLWPGDRPRPLRNLQIIVNIQRKTLPSWRRWYSNSPQCRIQGTRQVYPKSQTSFCIYAIWWSMYSFIENPKNWVFYNFCIFCPKEILKLYPPLKMNYKWFYLLKLIENIDVFSIKPK